ncbi:MAG TPA: competence/damage-inducible protein A [Bacteroidales bacterium]|nr:competence/damage-inducible protein A [Bacteroidales bacterium]
MLAEIITIGDEILIGQVVDTNSAYLAGELNKIGISVIRITAVPDIRDHIIQALDIAGTRAQLVITTGGLGPTSDDVTKQTLATYFGSKMVQNDAVLEHIRNLLKSRGVEVNELNTRQAELPDNCELLHNPAGTAQGMWFEKKTKSYISLPGVPFELKAIYLNELEHRLKQRFNLPRIRHITVLTHGVPESGMATLIHDWEVQLPATIKLAYLPSPGILRLRLTETGTGEPGISVSSIEDEVRSLEAIIGKHIFGYNDDRLEGIVGLMLKEHGFTLSLAESCTGGVISSMITSVPGSSAYYKGGITAYSNDLKTSELNVSPYTLLINGAVSQSVAEQMAEGARTRYKSDFSVAVTGIAGPSGGSDEKPVGTTWIAVASKKRIISNLHNFGEDRGRNMQKAAIAALFMLRNEIRDCL